MTNEDEKKAKKSLKRFIDECGNILQCMLHDDFLDKFIIEEMKEPLKTAWDQLTQSQESKIDAIKAAIDGLDEKSLERHGLYGKQLEAKLILFNYLKDNCEKLFYSPSSHIALKNLVDIIDILLGSIYDATGIGGALKEMKDIIYGSMKVHWT